MPTLNEVRNQIRDLIANQCEGDTDFEARELLCAAFSITPAELLARHRQQAEPDLVKKAISFARRRAQGEPAAYITGTTDFMGHRFSVEKGVLIPRADTEILVEEAIALLNAKGKTDGTLLEMGIGSGCIMLSILKALPAIAGIGSDFSPTCLQVTRRNAESLDVMRRLTLYEGSWYHALPASLRKSFALIVSNPPYIPHRDRESLQIEIRDHEPDLALFGDEEGLAAYREILAHAREWLTPEGSIMLEHGIRQAAPIAEMARNAGFGAIRHVCDTAGLERVLIASL